jgi:hypothetical protein
MPNTDSEQNIHPLPILALPGTAWKRHFQFVGILMERRNQVEKPLLRAVTTTRGQELSVE